MEIKISSLDTIREAAKEFVAAMGDSRFVSLLGKIRENRIDQDVADQLSRTSRALSFPGALSPRALSAFRRARLSRLRWVLWYKRENSPPAPSRWTGS